MELIGLNVSELLVALLFLLLNALLTGLVIAGVLILAYYLFVMKGKRGEHESADQDQGSR